MSPWDLPAEMCKCKNQNIFFVHIATVYVYTFHIPCKSNSFSFYFLSKAIKILLAGFKYYFMPSAFIPKL